MKKDNTRYRPSSDGSGSAASVRRLGPRACPGSRRVRRLRPRRLDAPQVVSSSTSKEESHPVSQIFETQFGGRTLTIETGKLARLAGGSVTVRYGDTMVLGTANRSEPRPGLDFFPLTVDFEERMYAAGKIPGGFIKREARPSENAILAARQTDRPIRPLFPEGYKDDVQLVITVLSTDQENNPDVLGTIAASAALTISEIPFNGPIGSVRVGRIDGEFVVNPTSRQLKESELDLIVAGTRDAIMMVEAGANLLPEDVMAEAILFGHRSLQPIVDLQEELQKAVGKPKRLPYIEPLDRLGPRLRLGDRRQARARRHRRRDDRHRPEDVRPRSRSPRSRSRARRSSTAGRRSSNPGRPIVGNQMHGITDKDVKGAPSPKEAADKLLAFVGDAHGRRPQRRLRPRLHRGGQGRRVPVRAGHVPRHPRHRPRGLPGRRVVQARRPRPVLRHRARTEPSRAAGRRGDREPAALVRERPAGSDLDPPRRRSPMRSAPSADGWRHATRCSRRPDARRASARACSACVQKKTVRRLVLDEGIRIDGRGLTDIRPITVEVGLVPRAHGSGLFTRGETQALTVATLGSSSDVQRIDTISPETEKRYLHHYNFPPYSTGENKMMRGPSRRDIGHGHLAERALVPVLPSHDEFPYVIRLVSECVTSNGSTSMASTCGSTLALMDAGVPIKAPVAGAAMGLISEPDGTLRRPDRHPRQGGLDR